jgi:hypothetical protein
MKVYIVACQIKNSKVVAWERQFTATSKKDAIRQAKQNCTITDACTFAAWINDK